MLRKNRTFRARELLKTVERGPYLEVRNKSTLLVQETEEVRRQYQLWVTSWVIPELRKLIPELKPVEADYEKLGQQREV